MSLEPGLISYAALASLALSVKKYRPTPPLAFMPLPTMARVTGWLLLAVALLLSAQTWCNFPRARALRLDLLRATSGSAPAGFRCVKHAQ